VPNQLQCHIACCEKLSSVGGCTSVFPVQTASRNYSRFRYVEKDNQFLGALDACGFESGIGWASRAKVDRYLPDVRPFPKGLYELLRLPWG
jgi:hypothetical protein